MHCAENVSAINRMTAADCYGYGIDRQIIKGGFLGL